jgi:hypothetical protein
MFRVGALRAMAVARVAVVGPNARSLWWAPTSRKSATMNWLASSEYSTNVPEIASAIERWWNNSAPARVAIEIGTHPNANCPNDTGKCNSAENDACHDMRAQRGP